MNDKIAVIDVGTNNILLLIARYDNSKIEVLERKSNISALGRNMQNRILTKAAIRRTRSILIDNISYSKLFTENILIMGTSCSRDAKNINEISDWLRRKYHLNYNIISGEKEAYLNGLANINEFPDNILLFDVGGGSTEFTKIQKGKITSNHSLDIGIRRLDSMFKEDFENKVNWVKKTLQNFKITDINNLQMVGIGGTATSISAIFHNLDKYDAKIVHKSKIERNKLQNIYINFRNFSSYRIKEKMAFEPKRADIMATGMMIVLEILNHFGKDNFLVSDKGIQFGVLNQAEAEIKRMLIPPK